MECWKNVKGFNGIYQVSSLGQVRSVDRVENCGIMVRKRKGKALKQTIESNGRVRVWLGINGRGKKYLVNRIVYQAFGGPLINGLDVMHLDDNLLNNCIDNLRQGSKMCNQAFRVDAGTECKGVSHGMAKLKVEDIQGIRAASELGVTQREIAQKYKISHSHVHRIVNFESWSHIREGGDFIRNEYKY